MRSTTTTTTPKKARAVNNTTRTLSKSVKTATARGGRAFFYPTSVVQLIKTEQKKNKISTYKLADSIGVERPRVYQWLSSGRIPMKYLSRILKQVGVKPEATVRTSRKDFNQWFESFLHA